MKTYRIVRAIAVAATVLLTSAASATPESGDLEWSVGTTANCDPTDNTGRSQQITEDKVICIAAAAAAYQIGSRAAASGEPENNVVTIVVAEEGLVWDATTVSTGITVTFWPGDPDDEPSTPMSVVVTPDLEAEVAVLTPEAEETERADNGDGGTDPDSNDGGENGDGGPDNGQSGEDDAAGQSSVGIIKVYRLSGVSVDQMVSTGELAIRDTVDPTVFRVSSEGSVLSPNEEGWTSIAIRARSGSYSLEVRAAANEGVSQREQNWGLYLGDTQLRGGTTTVDLSSPLVMLEVQTSGRARPGEEVDITVRVNNQSEVEAVGAYRIRLDAIGGQAVEFAEPTDSGVIEDDTVVWSFPEGFRNDDPVAVAVKAEIPTDATGPFITWKAEMQLTGTGDVVTFDEARTDLILGGSGSDNSVQFKPEQMVQLIAFIVSFALLAVIFGAWARRRRTQAADTESEREHELNLFRDYARSILVLVLIVAVLVLALQGSLNGESAASLIGVIAGYALGQGIRR